MEPKDDVFTALNACFVGDNGELHESGKVVFNWLRDVCNFGDSPLDPDHYDGDLVRLGQVIGRQEVFNRVIEAMNIPPHAIRQAQVEDVVRSSLMGEIDDFATPMQEEY